MTRIFKPETTCDRICVAAPGTSLTAEQCLAVMRPDFMTIGIGDVWRMNPYLDILYHCDARWWNHYKGVPEFKGCARVSLDPTDYTQNLHQAYPDVGLCLKESTIATGRNSGYQAINLAAHFKPKEIILIGFDMKDRNGKHNIIGDHPAEVKTPYNFSTFIKNITTLVKPLEDLGIKVYNCTIDSDLDCFEKKDLADVL